MAARTTQQSGNASNNAVWDGGTALLDGDSITIAAGHVLTWDMDKSAWTTGVAGITITSAAGTPAKLTFPTSGGPYVLPIKTATTISGSNAANKGQLYIGSQGTPIPNTTYIKIDLLTSASINCQYLDVQIFGTEPTHKFVRTLNAESAAATVIETDTDVSAEWAVGDLLIFANTRATTNLLSTATIASFSGSTINLSGGGLTYGVNAGAYVVKANRNVEIVSGVATAMRVIALSSSTVPGTWQCAIRQATQSKAGYGAGTTSNLIDPAIHTFPGVISGFSFGLVDSQNTVVSGIIANCVTLIGPSNVGTTGVKVSGALIGATSVGLQTRGAVLTPSGLIACCAGAGVRGEMNDIAGTIIGCPAAVEYSSAILRQGSVIGGSGNDANTRDIATPIGIVWGYGTSLRSATQVGQYLFSEDNTPGPRVTIYDVADGSGVPQPGQLAWWSHGGYGKSEAYSQGTHGTPPVTLAYVHKSNFETVNARNYIDIPINAPKNQLLTVTVWAKKSANGMTATPAFKLIDENRGWGHANEALATQTMADDTNWQTLTLTYTPTEDKQIALRAEGQNASGNMYWDYDVVIGSGGGGLLIHAGMTGGMGG